MLRNLRASLTPWPDGAYGRLFVNISFKRSGGKVGSFAALPFVGFLGFLSHQYKAKCDSFLEELEVAVRKLFGGVG